MSVKKGDNVKVIEKNFTGWWLIDSADGQGYLPFGILKKAGGDEILKPIVLETRKEIKINFFILNSCNRVVLNYFKNPQNTSQMPKLLHKNLWYTLLIHSYNLK